MSSWLFCSQISKKSNVVAILGIKSVHVAIELKSYPIKCTWWMMTLKQNEMIMWHCWLAIPHNKSCLFKQYLLLSIKQAETLIRMNNSSWQCYFGKPLDIKFTASVHNMNVSMVSITFCIVLWSLTVTNTEGLQQHVL